MYQQSHSCKSGKSSICIFKARSKFTQEATHQVMKFLVYQSGLDESMIAGRNSIG